MSAMPDRPAVLIVDHLPLRALGLVTILDRMCGPNRCRVAQTTEEARRWVDARSPLSMIIYNAAGASLADRRHAMRLKALRARVAGTPLVVFSDSDNTEEVISALRIGAQGFLYSGTDVERALQGLSYILDGGSYFSSTIALKHRASARAIRTNERRDPPPEAVPDVSSVAGAGWKALTERQQAVLRRLGKGESNKAIARQLGIREGTVKVHVRHILRKLGASNRTQIAIACASNGLETPPDRERLKV